MTDISRHIEYLLLDHDQVSVPQLGTFHIQVSESRWVPEEDLFLPPVRNVSFCADARAESEDFIHSLATALRCSANQAQAACAEYVESIRQELATNSVAEVGSIGMFVRDTTTGTDCFVPCQAGVASPEFYGLDSVYQPRLSERVIQAGTAVQASVQAARKDKDDRHVTIRIPRSLLYYASTVAAAVIVFFSFSIPAEFTSPETGTAVATANLFLPANLLPADRVSMKPKVTSTTRDASMKPAEKPCGVPTAARVSTKEPAPQAKYAVVLASAVSTANAKAYVKELERRNIHAELYTKGSMTRVLVPGFKSQDEAYTYMRKIRAESSEFDTSWVLKL